MPFTEYLPDDYVKIIKACDDCGGDATGSILLIGESQFYGGPGDDNDFYVYYGEIVASERNDLVHRNWECCSHCVGDAHLDQIPDNVEFIYGKQQF